MTSTLAAITAAGVVYDRADFADPHLSEPTALTVTSDGRVYGHLAAAGTCHIGYGDRCVTPPTSKSGYKYFHQGIVKTHDGDLPVGKITIGTGHATLGQDSVAAAAHYDNTGTVVAAVRAGEDGAGNIWLAGRIVPGTPPERIDELRRSGVSGDWRGINGQMELVAALAVNVPGFPVPRTEELVAAGGVQSLVAAGVVAPAEPLSGEELEEMVASAAARIVDERLATMRRRDRAVERVDAIAASAAVDRRSAAVAAVERVQAARSAEDVDALTAALDSGVPGHLPHALKNYWTRGAGKARWAGSPHPYTALVRALRSELPAKAQHMVNGLAANLFKATFGIYPGQRKELTAAAEGASGDHSGDGMVALLPAQADAQRLAVDGGEPADEMHLTLGYFPDVAAMPSDDDLVAAVTSALPGPVDATVNGHATFNPDSPDGKSPCAVYLVQGDGLTAAHQAVAPDDGTYDAYTPHITAQYDPTGQLSESGPVAFDRIRISRAGEYTDVPLGGIAAAGGRRVRTQEGADLYGVSIGDVIPKAVEQARTDVGKAAAKAGEDVANLVDPKRKKKDAPAKPDSKKSEVPKAAPVEVDAPDSSGAPTSPPKASDPVAKPETEQVTAPAEKAADLAHDADTGAPVIPDTAPAPRLEGTGPMDEDQSPWTGALGGKLLSFGDGKAYYDDGSWTDGTEWHLGDAPAAEANPGAVDEAIVPDDAEDFTAEDGLDENVDDFGAEPSWNPGDPVDDTEIAPRLDGDGPLEEDQAPETGAYGGQLTDFSDGVAVYDDGTQTDGSGWTHVDPEKDDNVVTASAMRRGYERIFGAI